MLEIALTPKILGPPKSGFLGLNLFSLIVSLRLLWADKLKLVSTFKCPCKPTKWSSKYNLTTTSNYQRDKNNCALRITNTQSKPAPLFSNLFVEAIASCANTFKRDCKHSASIFETILSLETFTSWLSTKPDSLAWVFATSTERSRCFYFEPKIFWRKLWRTFSKVIGKTLREKHPRVSEAI